MLNNLESFLTVENIYFFANWGVLPFWLMLIFLPNSKLVITRDYAQFIEANPNKDCEIEDVEESWNLLLCKF